VNAATENGYTPESSQWKTKPNPELNQGANVNAATEKGYTPIFTAAEHHNTAVALLLMDNGADMTLEVWP
jgi:ankyrin repeat protein